ncbi:MAG: RNA methyltransferase, partial [Deltaproteobacteria bacterium]|nr:RNA methyltransferase [Deltaproteobacteria bacterium]
MPFSSERTVVKLTEDRFNARARHWREIALNAAKQSCRREPVQIGPMYPLESVISQWEGEDLKVILWEEEGAQDLKNLLRSAPRKKTFVGIVGPEGGFDAREIYAAEKAGFVSVSLGRRILRASTAAISMVAIVQYEWGDLSLIP